MHGATRQHGPQGKHNVGKLTERHKQFTEFVGCTSTSTIEDGVKPQQWIRGRPQHKHFTEFVGCTSTSTIEDVVKTIEEVVKPQQWIRDRTMGTYRVSVVTQRIEHELGD